MKEILKKATERGQKALSEFDSKRLIAMAGFPVSRNDLARSREEAVAIARKFGFPVVLKGCSDILTHKTEMGMVKLKLKTEAEVAEAYDEIVGKGVQLDGVLVQEWIEGDKREFVVGLTRDPQFGPCVMFGLGGIFTEALHDVSFRIAPLSEMDAEEMIDEIQTRKLLGEFRAVRRWTGPSSSGRSWASADSGSRTTKSPKSTSIRSSSTATNRWPSTRWLFFPPRRPKRNPPDYFLQSENTFVYTTGDPPSHRAAGRAVKQQIGELSCSSSQNTGRWRYFFRAVRRPARTR